MKKKVLSALLSVAMVATMLVGCGSSETATTTAIRELNEKGRIDEIARMLGGVKLTDATFDHAKEMIENNRAK